MAMFDDNNKTSKNIIGMQMNDQNNKLHWLYLIIIKIIEIIILLYRIEESIKEI